MNGPGHYREAEKALGGVLKSADASDVDIAAVIAIAQVHATLALVAATTDAAAGGDPEHGFGLLDREEWIRVTS